MRRGKGQGVTTEPYEEVPLADLRLDPENPRLRRDEDWASQPEERLLQEFSRSYNLIEIARSIADKGFTPRHAEALLVTRHPSETATYVVIEGNRRLATLKLLTNEDARRTIGASPEWDALATETQHLDLGARVPVIIYPNREALDDYLGFRHITGPRPWRPEAKARFIAKLLRDGESIGSVARRIGSNHRTVRRYAEAHAVFTQAHTADFPTDDLEKGFGVFYNALDQQGVRDYLGLGRQADIETLPLSPVSGRHMEDLACLIGLLFGDSPKELNRVISDSRELRKLGQVLAHDQARANLIRERNLELAWRISGQGKEEVLGTLSGIYSRLAEINGKAPEFSADDDVREEVRRIYELVLDMAGRYTVNDE